MDTQTAGASYERSLGRSTRKANGVYYSPEPLVTYMVEATVGELLSRCESAEQALALRVYDPACGAGYFLVAAFRRIRDWLQTRGTELTPGLLRAIQEGCLFGRDVDRAALEVARLELPFANLTAENSLRARDGRRFHAVLGNPPYGVDTGSKGDSSRLFIEHALSSLEPGGLHSFIVPKPLLYSSTWHATLARLMPGILELVDCGAAWADVKLEQVIYVYAAGGANHRYRSSRCEEGRVASWGELEKSSFDEFGLALNGITPGELELGRALLASGGRLSDHVSNRRGARLQGQLGQAGSLRVYGGKQIARYSTLGEPKGYVEFCGDARARVVPGSLLAQNIVAHVRYPSGHLKLAATLALDDGILICDTVNQLVRRSELEPEVVLAVLNSKLVAWYVYHFIVGRAVRTIHLDGPVTSRIPFPGEIGERDRAALTGLVRERMAASSRALTLDEEIDRRVRLLFGV